MLARWPASGRHFLCTQHSCPGRQARRLPCHCCWCCLLPRLLALPTHPPYVPCFAQSYLVLSPLRHLSAHQPRPGPWRFGFRLSGLHDCWPVARWPLAVGPLLRGTVVMGTPGEKAEERRGEDH
ncbi:hypothetical protein HDK77DRAFT_287195 [Phyllosticta capitalensis]